MNQALMELVEEFAAFLTFGQESGELTSEFADWGRMRMRDILSALDAAERMELIAFFESRMMTEPEQFSEEAQRGFAAYDAFRRELPATLGIA